MMRRFHKHINFNDGTRLSILAGQYITRDTKRPFEIAFKNHMGVVMYGRIKGVDFRDGAIRDLTANEVRIIAHLLGGE